MRRALAGRSGWPGVHCARTERYTLTHLPPPLKRALRRHLATGDLPRFGGIRRSQCVDAVWNPRLILRRGAALRRRWCGNHHPLTVGTTDDDHSRASAKYPGKLCVPPPAGRTRNGSSCPDRSPYTHGAIRGIRRAPGAPPRAAARAHLLSAGRTAKTYSHRGVDNLRDNLPGAASNSIIFKLTKYRGNRTVKADCGAPK